MPHEPMPPEPIDGRRTATEPTDDLARAPTTPPAATHRHRAPDATPTSAHATTRPRPLPSTRRRAATSRRLTLGHQTAEPIQCGALGCTRRRTPPMLSTRRSAKALGTPLPRAQSASAERPWFASFV